jgi:tetratricopeptide (TPR) repeat protein
MDRNSNKNWSLLIFLTLILITFAVFYQVRSFEFVNSDDPVYVYQNPNVWAGITLEAIKWAFTTGYGGNWHPLTWLSHMLDWQLFGSNPAGHHLVNLIFHIANTLLLFVVLRQMTGAIWPSAFVAALFALHPLHVESVAWVSERKDVLSTFFWMLTMWAYVRFVHRPKIASYLPVVVFLALGLMAKPMLVTLPFVLLLLDYWPLGRLGKKGSLFHLFIEKIPLFAMSLASCIVTFIVQEKGGTMHAGEKYSFLIRLANASISYLQYINKMIWPVRLAYFYPHPGQNVSILYAVISAIFLLAVTIFILRLAKDHRYLFTGWFWYLGTLVPVIGLVQVGDQALADRYSYVTLTGLFIIIAWGLPDLIARWRYKKNALILPALVIISAMSICTYFQLRHWRDSLSLFQHALDVTENNYVAHFCIAGPLLVQKRADEAVYHCSEAVRIRPGYLKAQIGLANALFEAGRLDDAVAEYRKFLQIKPDDPNVLYALGIVLSQQGKTDEAIKYFAEAIRIKPDFAAAHDNIGRAMALQGRIDEAIAHFEWALKIKPDWVGPMNNIAWFLAASEKTTAHNPDKAIKFAQRACELTNYKNPGLLDTLAVAYAAAGDFSKAIETAEKALELCRTPKQNTLKEEIENRLVLYKAGKPYIDAR